MAFQIAASVAVEQENGGLPEIGRRLLQLLAAGANDQGSGILVGVGHPQGLTALSGHPELEAGEVLDVWRKLQAIRTEVQDSLLPPIFC